MNETQKSLALAQWDTWMDAHPLRSPADSYASSEVWLAATENMLGDPLWVGNLQAKISELEERLQTIGGHHAEEVRQLEARINRQAGFIQDRDSQIASLNRDIATWKQNLNNYAAEYDRQQEDQRRDEINEAVAAAVSEAMNEAAQQTAQALEEQKEHLEQVKEASLSAQEQILRQEFEQRFQHTVLEQDWLPRAEYLGAMRHQKEALEVNHQEAMERSEAEIRELQLQLASAEQKTIDQVTNFTDRMLADDLSPWSHRESDFHPDRRGSSHPEGHGGHRTPPEA
jgi:DNA repair exonuclease SbcCD ATPase subunit